MPPVYALYRKGVCTFGLPIELILHSKIIYQSHQILSIIDRMAGRGMQKATNFADMRRLFSALTFALILFLPPMHGNAQETWNLQHCIEHALTHNISIQQQLLGVSQSETNLLQSKANVLPSLNINAGHNYNFGRTIDPFTNQFVNQSIQSNSFSLQSGVVLFNGLQNYNNILQSKTDLQAALKDVEVLKNNISLNVSTLYLQIVQAHKQVDIIKGQLSITQAQIERSQKLLDGGVINRLSLLNLEAQKANDQLNLVNAENNLSQSYVALKTLLMLEPSVNFTVEIPSLDTDVSGLDISLEAVYQKALENMPEIEAAQLRVESASIAERVARGGRSPRLSMFANMNTVYSESRREIEQLTPVGVREIGYLQTDGTPVVVPDFDISYRVTPFGTQLGDNFGQAVGFGLNIPILNNLQVHNRIALSELQSRQQALNLAQAKNQLYTDVSNAYVNAESARKRYAAAVVSERAQQENFEYSNKRFEAGLLNSAELVNAKNNWANSQLNSLQALYEYIFRKNILLFYQGEPLQIR